MNQVHISTHPLVQHKLTLLRDAQTDSQKFRSLIREISILLCYEATADLALESTTVETPFAQAEGRRLRESIGLVPILRAGLGMVEGIWQMMPSAEVWHIGLRRDERVMRPVEHYTRLPVEPAVQGCLVLDPTLATGGSAVTAVDILKRWGAKRIKFVTIVAAATGIQNFTTKHPDVPIYLAAIDPELSEIGYIVPGIGDVGDRQFGTGR